MGSEKKAAQLLTQEQKQRKKVDQKRSLS